MPVNPQGPGQGIRNRPEDSGVNINRLADEAKFKAQEVAQTAGQKVQEAGAAVKNRTEDALGSVGQKMSNLGDTLREKAPHEGILGNAACKVADTMEAGGRYLQEHDLADMGHEVTSLIRRYPLGSIAAFFGLGCLVGMTMNRR